MIKTVSLSQINMEKDSNLPWEKDEFLRFISLMARISVEKHGIIYPVILKKEENGYSVIEGINRLRILQKMHVKEVPAIIVDTADHADVVEILSQLDLHTIATLAAYYLKETDEAKNQIKE